MKVTDRKFGPWPRNPHVEPAELGHYRNAEGELWRVVKVDANPLHLRESWRVHVEKHKAQKIYRLAHKKFVQWFDGPTRVVKWRKDRPLGALKVGWSYINKVGQEREILSITGERGLMEKHHTVDYRNDIEQSVCACTVETFRKWFNGKGVAA